MTTLCKSVNVNLFKSSLFLGVNQFALTRFHGTYEIRMHGMEEHCLQRFGTEAGVNEVLLWE